MQGLRTGACGGSDAQGSNKAGGVALCVECVQDAVRVLRENGIQISEK